MMLRFLIFAGLTLTVLATEVPDSKRCAEGPKFWCANLKNAKACQATAHCIQAVWIVQAYPKDNDLTCKVCEGLVVEARKYMTRGETEKAVEDLIISECKKVPYPAVSAECTSLAQGYLPEIMQLLAAETDPLTVCTAMRLCNNRRIDEVTKETTSTTLPPLVDAGSSDIAEITFNECEVCQMKMGNLARDVKKASDEAVMDRMFLICGELGTFSTACASFVATNFDKIREWIEDRLKPVDMCQVTNRCMQPTSKLVSRDELMSDNWCEMCTTTLDQWKDILVQNSTEEDFKDLLLDLCNEVGFMVDQCRDMVDQYYVAAYDWILHEFQPKSLCQDVGMCPGKELDSINLWPVVPAGTEDMLKSRVSTPRINPQIIDKGGMAKDGPTEEDAAWFKSHSQLNPIVKTPEIRIQPEIKPLNGYDVAPLPIERMTSVLDAAASESCAICQTVMHEIENVLMDGQTQDEIKSIVENICDRMPKALDTECKGFVERYGSLLIALLAQKFDPASVCPKLKLCPEGLDITIVSVAGAEFPKTVAYDLADAKKTEPRKIRKGESVTCVMCEYAVGMVQQALNDNATMDEVKEVLDSLCDRLPDSVAGECELLVNAYSEELIDAFILNLTPEQTCRYLQLCKPPKIGLATVGESTDMDKFLDFDVIPEESEKKTKTDKKTKVEASPGCILCEFVMRQMEDMLKDNKTDQNIEDNLKKVCKVMPRSIREDCTSFIDQYFNLILQTLEHVPPNEACTMLALCSHRGVPKPKAPKGKGQFKCAVCKDLMKLLKEVLMDERIDKRIANDFEKICTLLPKRVGKKYKSQCHDVMEHYGPYVVNMLASLEKPEELCSYIDMCDPIPGLVNIDPSVENCSLGPKYFCAKKKRAHVCGKVEFCKEEIWNKKKGGKKAKRATKN